MNQFLSQEEVDALLNGLEEGSNALPVVEHNVGEEDGVQPYDLTSQDRIAQGSLPTLEIIHQKLARQLRASLSGALRRIVDVTAGKLSMLKFGDFLKTLPIPTSLHVFRMLPLRGGALLIIESKMVYAFIDSIFGGSGSTAVKVEGRDFTSIETHMRKRIAKIIFEVKCSQALPEWIEAAWKPIESIHIELDRSEVNPQFVGIVSSMDIVVIAPLEIEMDDALGNLILCIPYATIEPIRNKLKTAFQFEQLGQDNGWGRRLVRQLDTVGVEISVELGTTEITVRTLLDLQRGDIIRLDQDTDSELIMRVEGVPKFRGLPRVVNQTKALEITSPILPPAEEEYE